MSDYHRACRVDQLKQGSTWPVEVEGYEITIILVGEEIYALEDRCSHADIPLSLGKVSADRIKCQAHGAEFCLKTGKALCAPAFAPVRVFPVKVENSEVWVDIE
jgi:3-phenylpropionate/trans-cinnamate dioxygenase ferredoxin component